MDLEAMGARRFKLVNKWKKFQINTKNSKKTERKKGDLITN